MDFDGFLLSAVSVRSYGCVCGFIEISSAARSPESWISTRKLEAPKPQILYQDREHCTRICNRDFEAPPHTRTHMAESVKQKKTYTRRTFLFYRLHGWYVLAWGSGSVYENVVGLKDDRIELSIWEEARDLTISLTYL